MYNEFGTIFEESDECLTKGICSVNPTLSSLHEIILLYLIGVSFYYTKLEESAIVNADDIKNAILYSLFTIITNSDYNQDLFHNITEKLYDYIMQLRLLYEKSCLEKNIEIQTLKAYFKYSKRFNLTDAIRKGEKYFIKKTQSFSQRQKDLYDIAIFLCKSIGIKLIELKKLGKTHEQSIKIILSLLNNLSPGNFSETKIIEEIDNCMDIYYDLARVNFYTQIELYGDLSLTEVSFSTHVGKAILVSGFDFKQLESVLKAVEGTDINVYTHGLEMLMAHAFTKIRSHPNLKGHFGTSLESSLIDFASFPGPILMTKCTLQRIDYLFRGRLFTLDPVAPMGITRLKDNDLESLIKSAQESKGFEHAQTKPSLKVGFNEKELYKLMDKIIDKIKAKEIKHIYFVGLSNAPNFSYKEYFTKFFELLPKDSFVFSLSYPLNKDNVFHLDAYYDYTLMYKCIKKLRENLSLEDLDLHMFITKCDKHTISNLLYLKHIKIKNVYMCKCPPTLIGPTIITTLQEVFGVKEFTDPKKDIEESH